VECRTYRRRGHSRSDPGNYRPKEEVEAWLAKDPIARLGRYLVEEGTATQAELEEIGNSISGEIEEAIRFSEESPFPDPSTAYKDVFTEM
jgi:pyruvate dehydrogenase E1 component alpha subunit